jgi:hypothetical protein
MLEMKTTASPFLFLAVDLPPPPLFQDAVEKNIIPQVSIYSILAKFDGDCTKNVFVEQKNPTIVNFPLRGLDFRECAFWNIHRVDIHSSGPERPAGSPGCRIRSHRQCNL